MKRRTFLNQMGYGLPASLALSSFLFSCKKGDDDGVGTVDKFKDYNVVVIGAGAAGLYTGWYLKERGFNVTILEASNRLGGRIKSFDGFSDYDIELGAERIYGSNTPWYDLVQQSSKTLNTKTPEDYYFFRQDPSDLNEPPLKDKSTAGQYSDFVETMDFVNGAGSYNGPDVSVESAFTTNSPWSMVGVANGIIGNQRGTVNSRLGMRGYSQEIAAQTVDGQVNTLENASLHSVLEESFSSVLDKIRYGQQVNAISYEGEMINVSTKGGQSFSADRVVVTVPLTILKSGDINFTPSLPNTKLEALEKMDMMAGMKVHLKFSSAFWEDTVSPNLGSIYGHNFLPEIYVSSLGRSDTPVLTAYIMGERAEQFSSMDDNTAITLMLSYLDEIFTSQAPTQSFVQGGYNIMDWSKEPFIYGAYSFPLVGGSVVFREELAKPIDNKIYFAGEATHYEGHSGTVHGAIESGVRVATEIEESIV